MPPTSPTHSRPSAPPARLTACLAAVLLCCAAAFPGGCYRKVVDARGVGAATVDIEEPDNPDAVRLHSKRRISPLERRGQTPGW